MQDRQLEILRAIVEEYVETEEPVGSKVIAARHQLGVSPATIRNDMAILEDQGLITRLFVDRIQEVKPLSSAERRAIESFLTNSHDLDDLLERTVRLLSQLTNQVALIRLPQDRVVVAGTANLAKSIHEEASALSPILESLEEQVILMKLLSDTDGFINVKIGDENKEKGLRTTSSVSMGYGQGAVGVLGPTRMDYAGSMAAVHAVARYIGRFISEGK